MLETLKVLLELVLKLNATTVLNEASLDRQVAKFGILIDKASEHKTFMDALGAELAALDAAYTALTDKLKVGDMSPADEAATLAEFGGLLAGLSAMAKNPNNVHVTIPKTT